MKCHWHPSSPEILVIRSKMASLTMKQIQKCVVVSFLLDEYQCIESQQVSEGPVFCVLSRFLQTGRPVHFWEGGKSFQIVKGVTFWVCLNAFLVKLRTP